MWLLLETEGSFLSALFSSALQGDLLEHVEERRSRMRGFAVSFVCSCEVGRDLLAYSVPKILVRAQRQQPTSRVSYEAEGF